MEELIKQIIEKLAIRENQTLTLSSKANFLDQKKNIHHFISYKNIVIKDIGVLLLNKVMSQDETNEVVEFIYTALNYGCLISLQLSFDVPTLINWEWLNKTPFVVMNYQQKEYRTVDKSVITYQDIALFDHSLILITKKNQKLTALASEEMEKLAINHIEGSI